MDNSDDKAALESHECLEVENDDAVVIDVNDQSSPSGAAPPYSPNNNAGCTSKAADYAVVASVEIQVDSTEVQHQPCSSAVASIWQTEALVIESSDALVYELPVSTTSAGKQKHQLPTYQAATASPSLLADEHAANDTPSYYPPKPKSLLVKILLVPVFPFYALFYLLPLFLWECLEKAAKLVWKGTCLVTGCIWEYVLLPVGRILYGILGGIWWVISQVAQGLWWMISKTAKGIWWVTSRVALGIWWVVSQVGQGIWWVVSQVARGIWWVLSTMAKGIWWVLSTVGSLLWAAVAWVGKGIWIVITSVCHWIWIGCKKICIAIIWILTPIFKFIKWMAIGLVVGVTFLWTKVVQPFFYYVFIFPLVWTWSHILVPVATFIWNYIFRPVWNLLVQVFEGCWWLSRTIGGLIARGCIHIGRAIKWVFTTIGTGIWWVLRTLGSGIAVVAKGVWRAVVSIGNGLWWAMRTVGNGILFVATAVWRAVVSIGKGLWWVISAIGKRIWLVVSIIGRGIAVVARSVWSVISAVGQAVWSVFSAVGRAIGAVISTVSGWFRDFVIRPLNSAVKAIGRAIHDALIQPCVDAAAEIRRSFRSVRKDLASMFR
ncbi:hypothetical protein HDU85_004055 [Gaertneriomyces sp. JEL0708]|nr:hypothetical protein HDU85_004055 [Gaertneriomyces sp. JEL0708]